MASVIDQNRVKKKIGVIGGGPVGCAFALSMKKRGHTVLVYEMRPDPRNEQAAKGKSINLTLAFRGKSALKKLGLKSKFEGRTVRCYGRKIHDPNGKIRTMLYGEKGESILSFDRGHLHATLLDAVEGAKIPIFFNQKLVQADFDSGKLVFESQSADSPTEEETYVDLIVGCDGAHSCMRKVMTKECNLSYDEKCIGHRYMELLMPARQVKQNETETLEFPMEEKYLHIWARGEFMMLALPNKNKSFTVSLFMPNEIFESLSKDRETTRAFVKEHFTDAVPLIGEEAFVDSIMQTKANPLISVKCSRYNIGCKVALLGDAAHAMVPFYGQGVNCGFEDVMVLDRLLDKHQKNGADDFEAALEEFTKERTEDAHAMCDLSMQNYEEIRKNVNSWSLSCRKKLDSLLHRMFPAKWIPLYTMVAFSDMRYSDCIKNKKWQDKVVSRLMWTAVGAVVTVGVGCVTYVWGNS